MKQVLIDALTALDVELTGKPLAECQNTARNQVVNQGVYDLMSNLYYLSDGGYSRVRIAEDYTAHLASGARAEIEFNWLYADRVIARLNEALKADADPLCVVEGCGFYRNDLSDYCPSHF